MRAAALGAWLVAAVVATTASAQDPAPKTAPQWLLGNSRPTWFHVSPDGRWVAAESGYRAQDSAWRMFPTDGGEPHQLEPFVGHDFEATFTADGKRFVLPGSVYDDAEAEDLVQEVAIYETYPPFRRRLLHNPLEKAEIEKRRLPQYDEAFLSDAGELRAPRALTGSRVLFDRRGTGFEVWDVATKQRTTSPKWIKELRDWWALSADGARLARSLPASDAIEIVDSKSLEVAAKVVPGGSESVTRRRFSPDGSLVLVVSERHLDPPQKSRYAYALHCYSAQDGRRLWSVSAGTTDGSWVLLDVTADHAVVSLRRERGFAVSAYDLRTGAATPMVPRGARIVLAIPSADGKGLWVLLYDQIRYTLTRMDLPPPSAK